MPVKLQKNESEKIIHTIKIADRESYPKRVAKLFYPIMNLRSNPFYANKIRESFRLSKSFSPNKIFEF